MPAKTNQSSQDKNKDFGLPQAEFKPIEAEGGKWLRITAMIVGLVLIMGAGILYWFFYHVPSSDAAKKTRPVHEAYKNEVQGVDIDSAAGSAPAQHQATVRDAKPSPLAEEPEVLVGEERIKDVNASPHTAKPQRGTITSIKASRGYYYVVVGSFIDDDLAADYANRLAQQGVDVMLIAPPQGQYYFRVAIEQKDRFYDAYKKLKALKATYGADIWVLKY